MHFLPRQPFSTYFPPLVLYFKQFLRGHGRFCGVFLFSFIFFFPLVLSKKCIKGTMVFLPSPSLLLSHNISCDSVGPLTMLLLDMVTDETAKSESLALGFRLWVVSCRRLPCQRHYNTKKIPLNMSLFMTFVPLTWHCKSISNHI